ncbi:hypothetical protein [Kitasatospora phosalacinea]|uniref:Uncharacterized protein n=1 Tax=Kitasatospora phosalacinea TaxID=2065 RepID=A0ABW6GRE1_9ACTN
MAKARTSRTRGGNTATLRRYWTTGPGAAKIRWGTPGDFNRCVTQVGRYLGPRAKGYCQLRHIAATGMATSTHAKALRAGQRRKG